MRRYSIEIDGRRFDVLVEDVDGQRFDVRVGERDYAVTLAGQEELALERIVPGIPVAASPAALATAVPAVPAPTPATAAPPPASARPAAAAPRAAAAAPRAAGGASLDVVAAPMPGVILRLAVAPGAQVRRGQDLAVLEAMKMENLIRAPRDGTIAEVCVAAGQQVAHGQPLLRYAKAP